MDRDTLVAAIEQVLAGVAIERAPSIDSQPTVYVPAAALVDAAQILRDDPTLGFSCLTEIAAVDFWPREPRFELVYLLLSVDQHLRLRMKVRVDATARVRTLSGIWPSANWLEREVWDLFGIEFEGHPDPRRLLMPEDWEGFPLRKDYPVQIHEHVRTTEPMQLTEEEFRANMKRDRLTRG